MSVLGRESRQIITEAGVSVRAYIASQFADGCWHGDRCGCPDDRCIGYHHDDNEECGCLPVVLEQMRDCDQVVIEL